LKKILITGVSGFIGSNLAIVAYNKGLEIRGAVRIKSSDVPKFVEQNVIGDISADTNWKKALNTIDIVIHSAARVHIMSDMSCDILSEYRKINVSATLNLAEQAAKAGVKRFIYLSSIKVNGEETVKRNQFTPEDLFIPKDFYALSKYEAEKGLLMLAEVSNMEVVIIRPPLVYGAGVKANFNRMMELLNKETLLPLGSIYNKRSLVALDNLLDLIIKCLDHPKAVNEIFLVSDGEDLSTTQLLQRTASALGKKTYLLPVNQKILKLMLIALGKKDLACRICGSLQVDISKTQRVLDWKPPVSVDEGLMKAAKYFQR
jgi:nucleoside-diphosphate-sugar epimerase